MKRSMLYILLLTVTVIVGYFINDQLHLSSQSEAETENYTEEYPDILVYYPNVVNSLCVHPSSEMMARYEQLWEDTQLKADE